MTRNSDTPSQMKPIKFTVLRCSLCSRQARYHAYVGAMSMQPCLLRKKNNLSAIFLNPFGLIRFLTDRKAPIAPKLLALFALAYLLMPVDLIPDMIPIIGWLDDIGVLSMVVAWIAAQSAKYEETKPSQQT